MNFSVRPPKPPVACVAVNLVAIPLLPGAAPNQLASSTLITYHRAEGGEFVLANLEPECYRAVANALAEDRAFGTYRYGQWRYLHPTSCKLKS